MKKLSVAAIVAAMIFSTYTNAAFAQANSACDKKTGFIVGLGTGTSQYGDLSIIFKGKLSDTSTQKFLISGYAGGSNNKTIVLLAQTAMLSGANVVLYCSRGGVTGIAINIENSS